ncbi:hypothetical protein D3C76_1112500 [compost metagenome]
MSHLQAQAARIASWIAGTQHLAQVFLPTWLGAHHAGRGAAATGGVDQGRADVPQAIAGLHGGAQRRGLLNANADRQPGQHSLPRLEVDDFRQRVQLGPGQHPHDVAGEGPGIDFQWYLACVFGKGWREQPHPVVKHQRRIREQLLVIKGPHHRRHRIFSWLDRRPRGHRQATPQQAPHRPFHPGAPIDTSPALHNAGRNGHRRS